MRNPVRALFLLLLVGWFTACSQVDRVNGGTMYNCYTVEEEVALGRRVMESALAEGRKNEVQIDAPAFRRKMQEIVRRIARVSHYPEFPWEVHTMDAPGVVNAWCAPGGKIMVYSGLFTKSGKGFVNYSDPDEVAAVIGHEIAHATCRHVGQAQSVHTTVFLAIFPAWLALAIVAPELLDVWDVTVQAGFGVWAASYSREHESEADRVGAEYAARAGYDPRAAIAIWNRAHEMYGSEFRLYGTHPPNRARAEALKAMMPRLVPIYERVRSGWTPPPYTWEK